MFEVDIEVSETEHTVSDINVALIPLFLISFALTGGYYIFSLLTTHEREPIPSFVDFLELHDWPPEHYASECIDATDHESNSPLEQSSLSAIGCGGLVGLRIAQESVENGSPCELVVTAHAPCFPVNTVHKPPRFHHCVYHPWPKLRIPPALYMSQNDMMETIITVSGRATKTFNVLVGEPAYFNMY